MVHRLIHKDSSRRARWVAALLAICLGCAASSAVAMPSWTGIASPAPAWRDACLIRIAAALENKGLDRALSAKAKGKLGTLSDRHVRIAAALADRTANGDTAAGAETAYLLLALLIVLS